MKNNKKIELFLSLAIILSGCIKDNKASSNVALLANKANPIYAINSSISEKTLDVRLKRYALLKDTNQMDPRKMDIMVSFITSFNSDPTIITKQKDFIRTSGFPVVGDEQIYNFQKNTTAHSPRTLTNMSLANMSMNLQEADAKYKLFVKNNLGNKFINTFKQNTAALIFKKYILDNTANNSFLKFYIDELVQSNCQDYGLLYLGLNQLNEYITPSELSSYKQSIMSNKEGIKFRNACKLYREYMLQKSKSTSGNTSKYYLSQASFFEIPKIRSEHFFNKINNIKSQQNSSN